MGYLILYSLIAGILSALLLLPLTNNERLRIHLTGKMRLQAIGGLSFLCFIGFFLYYYITNQDLNVTSLWLPALIFTAGGALLSSGLEQKLKGILLVLSLLASAYLLSAFMFNANEKYEVSKMDVKTEIKKLEK